MSGAGGWSPVREPRYPRLPDNGGSRRVTDFMRLARVHALSAAGDAMIAVALADSLFFSVEPDAARSSVLWFLALTLAPFALVAPLIGPAVDRAPGGRRLLIVLLNAGRAVTALFMIGIVGSRWLAPLAFAILVLGKGYAVAKASIVPITVRSEDELVSRNSRLAVLSGVAGLAGGVPAWLIQRYAGSDWVIGVATGVFLGSCALAFRLPPAEVAPRASTDTGPGKTDIRGFGIRLAASGTAVLRGVLGFMTFLVAFGLRDEALWQVYLVGAFAMIGVLSGAAVAARMRSGAREESILQIMLVVPALVSLLAIWDGGLRGAIVVALVVGLAASAGKVAFDSVVQRDAPNADYGRSFGRFETRFQLSWVVGSALAVIPMSLRLGFILITLFLAAAVVLHLVGAKNVRRGQPPPSLPRRLPEKWHRRPNAGDQRASGSGSPPAEPDSPEPS
ncbi:MAG: MFS transporter [bacterium]|nr:MFS transporter [bacterium]